MFDLKKTKKILLTLFCFLLLAIPVFAISAYDFNQDSGLENTAEKTGHTMGIYDGSLSPRATIIIIITNIIQIILSLMGISFLIIMIYGGYTWMTAQGNQENVEKGKRIIANGILGVVIVFIAYAFSYLLVSIFSKSRIG